MMIVTLYTRDGCKLCDEAKNDLANLQGSIPHRLVEIDIDDHPDLQNKFFDKVPVIEIGPYSLYAPFTSQELMMTLGAARDRMQSLERLDGKEYLDRVRKGQELTGADRFSLWISKHYLAVLNILMFLYVGLPFLAPTLLKVGATAPANAIYTVYSPLCHQLGFRSFFLFGPQVIYPRESAGIEGVLNFGEATGIHEDDLIASRLYRGDEHLGYKVALCERDIAIYGAMLGFGLLYAITGRRFKPLNWLAWIAIGIVPIGLDGFSQLISQLGLPALANILPYRESTPFLRVLTGGLFGFTTAWFGFTVIEENMRETRRFLTKKFAISASKDK